MKKTTAIPILFLLVFSFTSCSKSNNNTAAGTSSNNAFSGVVSLVNQNDMVSTDNSGTTVTVENSNPAITATTDSKGNFSLPNLSSSSTVSLVFSHPGYGTTKKFYTAAYVDSVRKGQRDFICNTILVPQSNVTVNSLSGSSLIKMSDSGYLLNLSASISTANTNNINGITILIQKNNSNLSNTQCNGQNINGTAYLNFPVSNGAFVRHFSIQYNPDCFYVSPGDSVYVQVYGSSYSNFGTYYFDQTTNLMVFPTIADPKNMQSISFKVP